MGILEKKLPTGHQTEYIINFEISIARRNLINHCPTNFHIISGLMAWIGNESKAIKLNFVIVGMGSNL